MLTQTTALAPDGQPWQQVTLRNKSGMTVTVADWGATLLSAEVPLADGSLRRPLLGCAKLEDYARQAAFLGASVGRYANRIGHSRFPLDGQVVNVTPSNDAGHQLHGGPEGFDKRRWRIVRADEQEVLFALTSPDGDQGFPVAAGFVIFRIFDMWKPWPIRWFDRNIHGGMGIMVDDIVAGVISAGVLYVIGHHWPIGLL